MIRLAQRLLAIYARAPLPLRWLLVVAWAGAIWWSSSRSPTGSVRDPAWAYLANGAHVVVFAVLALLLALCLGTDRPRRLWLAFALAAAYGVVDEVHQSCVPGRDVSAWDVVSDGLGAALSTVGLRWLGSRARWAMWSAVALALLAVGSVALAAR